jgi:hypothetical protein
MIFQITQPWMTSQYCLEEFGWFIIQSVHNLERGQPVACIFMVFEESKTAFTQLLAQLRVGLTTKQPSECITGYTYERMRQAFKALDSTYADVAAGRRVTQRAHLNALFTLMTERCLNVPPGFAGLSVTEHYDAQEQRIALAPSGAAPANSAYTHDFNFNYGMAADFMGRLFEMLDPDLARAGVFPV